MKSTDSSSIDSRHGSVDCTITVEGDHISQDVADDAVSEGMAKAQHTLGHIAENMFFASKKAVDREYPPAVATQNMELGGVTITVTVRSCYYGVHPYIASMALTDAPSNILKSMTNRALGMSKREVLTEIAKMTGDEGMIAEILGEEGDGDGGFAMMPGMPGMMRRPRQNSNGSESLLGQYL